MNTVGLNKATCSCEHECKLEPVEAEDTEYSRVFAGECANCGMNHYYKVTDVLLESKALAAIEAAKAKSDFQPMSTASTSRSNR